MKKKSREYRCSHCKKTVVRRSDKCWLKSWCESEQRYVRLILVKKKCVKRKSVEK